ncbi:APC family permease [Chryseobacterium sp. A301]
MENQKQLVAKYGLFTAISMVVGQVIGSGIFFKVDDVLFATEGSALAGLLGFFIVGISVIFASITMANYAQLIPKDGGILSYVEYRFGSKASALVGWIYLSLFYPLLTAVLFTVSGIYISHFIAEFYSFTPSFLHYSAVGFLCSFVFFLFNIYRPKSSGLFQQLTTVLKLIPLLLIASFGVLSMLPESQDVSAVSALSSSSSLSSGSSFWTLVAASFIPIAFAFDGWYIATQISGEVKNARKNLPKALIIGTSLVLVVYVLYYLGIVLRMSPESIMEYKDTYIIEYSKKFGSNAASWLMQLFIIISVLGTANGLMLASIRVPFQFFNLKASKKFLNLGKLNSNTGMPVRSAYFAYVGIIFYILAYFFTNTHRVFTELNYDISAIPIAFIYMVNGALFVGLFKLLREGVISNQRPLKSIIAVFALLGIAIVLIGTASAQNGLSYLLVSAVYIAIGLLFIRNK